MTQIALVSKRFVILFLAIMLSISLTWIGGQGASASHVVQPPDAKGDDFTHSVVLELFVTTWCGNCPSAEAVAKQLNSEYAQNFVFVSMVTDVNDKAGERSDDYQVLAIPDGVFDGGYRREVGSQSDTSTYEGHIEDCGNRDAPDIELSVETVDNEDGTMDVSYSATYNDMYPFYDTHLRVYITERNSRYLDTEGHAIPYGFIDYAFDEDIRLTAQVETTDTATWQYDDYENASFSNFVVIATLFDKTTGVERYAVQSATTETTNILISEVTWTPEHPGNKDDMTITANVSGDVSEVELEYSICTENTCGVPNTVSMDLAEGTIYTTKIGDFGDDSISVHLKIVARDPGGNEIKSQTFDIEFGEGSGEDDEGFFSENGTIMASGGLALVLAIVLVGLFLRNKGAKQELKELQDRVEELEERDGEEQEGEDIPDGSRDETFDNPAT